MWDGATAQTVHGGPRSPNSLLTLNFSDIVRERRSLNCCRPRPSHKSLCHNKTKSSTASLISIGFCGPQCQFQCFVAWMFSDHNWFSLILLQLFLAKSLVNLWSRELGGQFGGNPGSLFLGRDHSYHGLLARNGAFLFRFVSRITLLRDCLRSHRPLISTLFGDTDFVKFRQCRWSKNLLPCSVILDFNC